LETGLGELDCSLSGIQVDALVDPSINYLNHAAEADYPKRTDTPVGAFAKENMKQVGNH
jgi:hypothetical protein